MLFQSASGKIHVLALRQSGKREFFLTDPFYSIYIFNLLDDIDSHKEGHFALFSLPVEMLFRNTLKDIPE